MDTGTIILTIINLALVCGGVSIEVNASVTLDVEKTSIIRQSAHACRSHYNQNEEDKFIDAS